MNYRNKFVPFICAVFMLLSVVPALAADPYKGSLKNPNPLAGLKNAGTSAAYDTAKSDPTLIISDIIGALLGLLGLIFIVLIIYAGFLWMTAQGNEEQIGKAKKMITNAVIGIIITAMAYTISSFVIAALPT